MLHKLMVNYSWEYSHKGDKWISDGEMDEY